MSDPHNYKDCMTSVSSEECEYNITMIITTTQRSVSIHRHTLLWLRGQVTPNFGIFQRLLINPNKIN